MPFETLPLLDEKLLLWEGGYLSSEYHGLKPGQTTDDTRASRLLAESLIACRGYDPDDLAKRYASWFTSGDHRGMGRTTVAALERLSRGVPWRESGEKWAEGNGTAMRAGVLGAFFRGHAKIAANIARDEARITHNSDEAAEGSAAVAAAMALLIEGASKERAYLSALDLLSPGCKVRHALQSLSEFVERRCAIGDVLGTVLPTGAHVVQTVPAAFAAVLLTDSYESAILAAIRAGGDTDTTAAIAGGLAGALYGRSHIPERLLQDLEDRDDLQRIEEALIGF
jgi:ADP-ribosylglycohydrolase